MTLRLKEIEEKLRVRLEVFEHWEEQRHGLEMPSQFSIELTTIVVQSLIGLALVAIARKELT